VKRNRLGQHYFSWGSRDISVDLSEIGFKNGANVRDVWQQQDLGRKSGVVTRSVPRHGVALLIVSE
jgi:alpha-galactosidase